MEVILLSTLYRRGDTGQRGVARVRHQVAVAHCARRAQARRRRALRHRHRRGLVIGMSRLVCRAGTSSELAVTVLLSCRWPLRRAVGVQFRLGEGVRRTQVMLAPTTNSRRAAHVVVVIVVYQSRCPQRHIARVRHQVDCRSPSPAG